MKGLENKRLLVPGGANRVGEATASRSQLVIGFPCDVNSD